MVNISDERASPVESTSSLVTFSVVVFFFISDDVNVEIC